ncbi:MAG: hypothetical protein E7588_08375 [Ruminococcaceae bacterium]|nr:hypothetical protein [Oscillospiraceae bacterium]
MGTGLIIAGTIFLLNPNINIVDLLPDFIGYILIFRGLFRLADMDDRMASARKKAKWLLFVSLAKIVFMLQLPSSSDSDVLLFTFCFAVIEILLCIPLFSEFFGGMNYLCSRYDNETALKSESEAKALIYIFLILKNALPVIPELFSLNDATYGFELNHDHYKHIRDMEIIKKISVIGAFVIVLICAVVIGIKFISYLRKVNSDKQFISRLEAYYRENILSDSAMWARRHQNLALTFFAVGIMFFNNIYLDTFPVTPDSLGYIFFLAGAFYLAKLGINVFCMSLLSVAGTAICAVSNIYRMYCSGFGAFSGYYWDYFKTSYAIPLDIICAVIFIATTAILLRHIRTVTADNPDGVVFPSKVLTSLIPVAALSTMLTDLLPILDKTAVSDAIPDYYAIFAFIIPVCTLAVTSVCAAQMLKMRTAAQ